MKSTHLFFSLFCLIASACGTSVPSDAVDADVLPRIYPDYTNVTMPVNMAPPTFQLDEAADGMVARYAFGDDEIVCADKMQPDMAD